MGWDNPPVPWREFEQRLSLRSGPPPVPRLPTGKGRRRGPDGPDRDGADRDGPDRDGPDRDGPDRDGPDRDGADRDGADRVGLDGVGLDRVGAGPGGACSGEPGLDGPRWAELHCHSSYSFLD